MITYSKFRPTSWDIRGLGLEDRQDWLVAPCGLSRDSGVRETANWRAMLRALGGESDDVEIHRFGHWACGWLEIVIVRPDSAAATEAESIECGLADYPIVCDTTHGEVESEFASNVWRTFAAKEAAGRIWDSYFDHSEDLGSRGRLREIFSEGWEALASDYDAQNCPEYDDEGCPDVERWIDGKSRDEIAALIRAVRKHVRESRVVSEVLPHG